MYKTIIRRSLMLIPQLLAVTIFIFLLAAMMPGDVLTGFTIDPSLDPATIARMRYEMGLDRPWYLQYVDWVGNIIFSGDFGRSFHHGRPVLEIIGERAANTFRLASLTLFLTYLIAIPCGMLAGRFRESILDKSIVIYTFFAMAMPTLLLALFNIFLFGFNLGMFPILGSVDVTLASGTFEHFMSRIHHLILPAFTGALLSTAFIINMLRSEILDNEAADYVTTARSKGVPEKEIYSRHIFRNSFLPVAASFAGLIPALLGGSIFIERIFSFPGMGNLFMDAIIQRDFPIVNSLVLIFAALIVAGTLLADITIAVVDPRVRIK